MPKYIPTDRATSTPRRIKIDGVDYGWGGDFRIKDKTAEDGVRVVDEIKAGEATDTFFDKNTQASRGKNPIAKLSDSSSQETSKPKTRREELMQSGNDVLKGLQAKYNLTFTAADKKKDMVNKILEAEK